MDQVCTFSRGLQRTATFTVARPVNMSGTLAAIVLFQICMRQITVIPARLGGASCA